MTDLHIECQCGSVRGVVHRVDKKPGERVRCYCRDCQSYAHHLGNAQKTLDKQGGTGMYLTSPQGIEFTQGREHIACLQLSPQGPLRWYANCCKTPLGNTMKNPQIPFVSLPEVCLQEQLEIALGPKELGIFAKDAHGNVPKPAYKGMSLLAAARVARRLIRARLLGEHKRSPYFDATGQPIASPQLLSKTERQSALAQAGFA